MSDHKFKPFEKVLVRDTSAGDGWRATFFSHYISHYSNKFGAQPVAIGGWMYDRMIPYEGNEHLLGTTDWPEPELKKGDIVAVWDKNDSNKMIRVYSHYDSKEGKHVAYMMIDTFAKWDYAEKFVPAPVEDSATRS